MRGSAFLFALGSCIGLSMATPDYDFSGSADTGVYINNGNNALVIDGNGTGIRVSGAYEGIRVTTPMQSDVTIGQSQVAINAYGDYWDAPAIMADGFNGIISVAHGSNNATGVAATAGGTNAKGVSGGVVVTDNYTSGTGVSGVANTYDSYSADLYGTTGLASAYSNAANTYGVQGTGQEGYYNYGVNGLATGGVFAYGVYGEAYGAYYGNWAGYFNGDVNVTGSCYCYPSDEKLKKNVKPMEDGLKTVMALKPKTYDMKVEEYKGKLNLAKGHQLGMIAQDVEQVLPDLVTKVDVPARELKEKNGKVTKVEAMDYKTLNYVGMIPVLVKAIQEQQAKIEALEKKLAAK